MSATSSRSSISTRGWRRSSTPSGNGSSTSTTKSRTDPDARVELAGWGGQVLAVGAVLWATRHEWGARAASGDDVMGHLVRTRWGIEHLLLHGHLDGWMPTFAVGYREFLFYGPGFVWLAALVRLLTLGFLSDAGAVKVLAIASVALFPVAVAYLARSMGLTARAAGAAALLSLLVDNPIGLGLSSTFATGQIPDQVGEVVGCVAIGALLRVVQHGRRRDVVVAAVAAALTLITHSITVLVAIPIVAITVPMLWVTERPRLAHLRSFAIAVGFGAGLAAFWLVPFIVSEHLHGPATTFSTPSLDVRLAAIMKGTFLFRRRVAALVLVGAGLAVLRAARGRAWGAALVLTPVAYIALDRLILHRYPGSEPALYLENRGIGLIAVIATFGLAAAGAWVTRPLEEVGDIVLLAAAAALMWASVSPLQGILRQEAAGTPAVTAAAAVIARVVPPGARYAEVRQFPQDVEAAGVTHPDIWLEWMSGRPALNEFNVESTDAVAPAFVPEHVMTMPAPAAADALARLGVTHVVTATAAAAAHLLVSNRFGVVWSDGPWAVLSVAGAPDQPPPASQLATSGPANAELTSAGPDHLTLDATAPGFTPATVALGWTPQWQVRIDGVKVPDYRSADGLVAFTLPAGRSTVSVRLRPDPWTGVGAMITVLTLVAGGGVLMAGRRRPGVLTGSDASPPGLSTTT